MSASTIVHAGQANRLQYDLFLAATDVARMRARLLEVTGRDAADDVGVLDAKLEPGRPAVVLYQVGEDLVHGTVPVPDDGAHHMADIVLSRYPDDPGLPGLPCAESPDCLARSIERGHLDEPVSVEQGETRLLRYRPGRRATFEVSARMGAEPRADTRLLVAKVYHDTAKAAAVVAEGRELAAQVPSTPLVLARIVAHDDERAIVVQEHLPGRVLTVDLDAPVSPQGIADVEGVAAALAAFHGLTVSGGRARSLERELQRFVTRSTGVRSVDEPAGTALLDLAHRLLALPPPDLCTSLVHGDCKPSQFLLHGSRVALLDLDHCGLADPAYDVGNFVASLRQQAVQQSQQAVQSSDRLDRALELGSVFVDAYSAAARTAGPHPAGCEGPRFEDRAEVFVAVSLMRKALRAFARSPQSPIPLRLVAEAHRGLDHPEGES